MNCTICGQPIVLVPSAAERAAKDKDGTTASYYTNLFTEHTECALWKRDKDVRTLMVKTTKGPKAAAVFQAQMEYDRLERVYRSTTIFDRNYVRAQQEANAALMRLIDAKALPNDPA
jgi:hypothetical protein